MIFNKLHSLKMPDVLAWINNYQLITATTWNHVFLSVAGLIAIAFIMVFSHIPITILANAAYDEGLFMQLGQHLGQGQWLGPFNQLTLAKGPGYPLFLAVNYWLGLPVSIAHALFHCAAAAWFGWVIMRMAGSRILGLTIFCLLLWHPIFLTQTTVREAIYTGQIILVYALATYSLLVATERRRQIQGGVATGLMLGWCWLTREEGVTLLPGLAVLILAALFSNAGWSRLRRNLIAGTVGVAALAFFATQTAFQLSNYIAYGSFVGVDFKEANFVSAVNALQSVRDGELKGFVPVSRSTREKIYSVSHAFATLKDYIEADKWWQIEGCRFLKSTCGEIAGGWFLWVLRDAVASCGHYQSPAKASEFFKQLASEVNTDCTSGKLKCGHSWIPYMPYTTPEQLAKIPERFGQAIRYIALLNPVGIGNGLSNDVELAQATAFLNYPMYAQPKDLPRIHSYLMDGWYFAGTNNWFTLEVKTPAGQIVPATISRNFSPDLVKHFGTEIAKQQRFIITTSCQSNCQVIFYSVNKDRLDLSMDEMVRLGSGGFNFGSGYIQFDAAREIKNTLLNDPANDPRIKMSYAVATASNRLYATLMPWLLALGSIAFIGGILCFTKLRKFEPFTAMLGIAASLWIFIFARVAILVLVDVTSFVFLAMNLRYLGTAMYLAPVAALLSLWAVMLPIRDYWKPF